MVRLTPVEPRERAELLAMAERYSRELDPGFAPRPEWPRFYEASAERGRVAWIERDGARAGFAIYGLRPHRWLPLEIGWVWDFYVEPAHRGAGTGEEAARLVLAELRERGAERLELEVAPGNDSALRFWAGLGFERAALRLRQGRDRG